MGAQRTIGLAVLLLMSSWVTANRAEAGDRDPRLPEFEPAGELQGPYQLEVQDLRPQSLEDGRWLGNTVSVTFLGGIPIPHQTRWRTESQVVDFVTRLVIGGAAGAGYAFEPLYDELYEDDEEYPPGRLVLVVEEFFCDFPGMEDPGCVVELTLERPLEEGGQQVWQFRHPEPNSVGGKLGPAMDKLVATMRRELSGTLPPPPPRASRVREGAQIQVAWLPDGDYDSAYTVMRVDGSSVCVATDPRRWVGAPLVHDVFIPGGEPGGAWGALDVKDGVVFGRQVVRDGVSMLDVGDRMIPYDDEQLAGSGHVPTDREREWACRSVFGGAEASPAGPASVWLVDRHGKRVSVRQVRESLGPSPLRGLWFVSSDHRTYKLSVAELVALLDDPDLNDVYEPRRASAERRFRTDGLVSLVMGSVLLTGIGMGVGALQNPENPASPYIGGVGGALAGIGGTGMGFGLLRFGFANRNLKRVRSSRRVEGLDEDELLLDAVESYNKGS